MVCWLWNYYFKWYNGFQCCDRRELLASAFFSPVCSTWTTCARSMIFGMQLTWDDIVSLLEPFQAYALTVTVCWLWNFTWFSMLSFFLQSVQHEPLVLGQWYLVCSCLWDDIVSTFGTISGVCPHSHGLLTLKFYMVFNVKFFLQSVQHEPLVLGQWYLVCSCLGMILFHFWNHFRCMPSQSWSVDFEFYMVFNVIFYAPIT